MTAVNQPTQRSQAAASQAGSWYAESVLTTGVVVTVGLAAVECRSETATALTTDTFDGRQMNWAMLGEFVLAVLVTQMDALRRILGTTQLNLREFAWALVPALVLLAPWELGKLIRPADGRRTAARGRVPGSLGRELAAATAKKRLAPAAVRLVPA